MNAITRRIRRLEEKLPASAETEESKRIHRIILGIQRRRAARLGLPIPDAVLCPHAIIRRERASSYLPDQSASPARSADGRRVFGRCSDTWPMLR